MIKVDPIRNVETISDIKTLLCAKPRDLCIFVLGINTAYRANELLSITCDQVRHLQTGDVLELKQTKTKKNRAITLNHLAAKAIQNWLRYHPNPVDDAPLFISRTGNALTVSTLSNMVKGWCTEVGLRGNYSSHTLRKTWGYHKLRSNNGLNRHLVLPILMLAYGHARQEQTLEYLCIQSDEVTNLYMEGAL